MSMQPEHRVLIVDDEPSVRWLLAIAFDRQGIESDVAESGKEAVALLTRTRCRYCCVVLDLKIPPPDGIEVTKFIYQNCRDLPVVVVSGHSHKPARLERSGVLYLNPGSAGPRRFHLPVTVARLDLRPSSWKVDFIDLCNQAV